LGPSPSCHVQPREPGPLAGLSKDSWNIRELGRRAAFTPLHVRFTLGIGPKRTQFSVGAFKRRERRAPSTLVDRSFCLSLLLNCIVRPKTKSRARPGIFSEARAAISDTCSFETQANWMWPRFVCHLVRTAKVLSAGAFHKCADAPSRQSIREV